MVLPMNTSTARGWDVLRRRVRSDLPPLYPIGPGPARGQGAPPECDVCRGPVAPRFVRCWQCTAHHARGRGLLADAVVPVSYAVKGTPFAAGLWRYKSWRNPDAAASASLQALLLVFLRDHGPCVWQRAGIVGPTHQAPPHLAPTHLAVVPTGCGRPGIHPLLALSAPCLRLPQIRLTIRPGTQGRDLDPERFAADRAADGASVLLIDDTWVSGASAQAAAVALKSAGARRVAVVVLGRHLDPADPRTRPLAARLVPSGYSPAKCAVHPPNQPTPVN
jgi:hypothetical protein